MRSRTHRQKLPTLPQAVAAFCALATFDQDRSNRR